MKKLMVLGVIFCSFMNSCEKPILPKKYTIEIRQNNWTDTMGDDYETKTEEIITKNLKEAYATGYKNYMISKKVSEATNGKIARRIIISFRVLDEKRKNIVTDIPPKSLDSIHTTIDKETEYITDDLKNKIIDYQNTKTK
ncbi:MAG TPA: hypothetical protein VF455_03075 [Chryseobacterium sp.]